MLGRGRRIVFDVAAHHLGDEVSVTQPLDPPQPEGLTLDRTIELAAVPDGPAELVLDVVGVVPEAGDSRVLHPGPQRRAPHATSPSTASGSTT